VAAQFDVAGRLAEGRPAVDDVQTYVSACDALGSAHPDLTGHRVADWYDTEDGLDLHVLDADCARLQVAVAATEQAHEQQARQLAALSDSWRGDGARAAVTFLRRHGDASAAAVAALRIAADALTQLRDQLWRAVDGKVAATLQIDGRVADRAAWLTAAQAVTRGTGDQATASELVDLQVKPFVANDIGGDWLSAMRAATGDVAAAYDAAAARLTAGPEPVFDVPAEWGPTWSTVSVADDAETVEPLVARAAATVPAGDAPPAWGAPAAVSPWAGAAAPAPGPAPAAAPSASADPAPAVEPAAAAAPVGAPSLPGTGGIPDVAGGLSGLGQQFADMLGGLLGTSDGALSGLGDGDALDDEDDGDADGEEDDPLGEDEPLEENADEDQDDAPGGAVTPGGHAGDAGPPADTAPVGASGAAAPPAADCVEPPAPTSAPLEPPGPPLEPAPPPAEAAAPPPPAPPPEPGATPCEIAADEVPQAGP
jgi:hypothetical protein